MSTFTEYADAFAETQEDGDIFYWRGKPYMCVTSGASTSKPLVQGGIALDSDLSIRFTTDQFKENENMTPEQARDVIINTAIDFDGRKYKVEAFKLTCGGLIAALSASDVNQRV